MEARTTAATLPVPADDEGERDGQQGQQRHCYVAVDVGTQGVRAGVVSPSTEEGGLRRLLGRAERPLPLHRPRPGLYEQSSEGRPKPPPTSSRHSALHRLRGFARNGAVSVCRGVGGGVRSGSRSAGAGQGGWQARAWHRLRCHVFSVRMRRRIWMGWIRRA